VKQLYQQYLEAFEAYVFWKGYIDFEVYSISFPESDTSTEPMPEEQMTKWFLDAKTLDPLLTFTPYTLPWGVKPIFPISNNPDYKRSFARPDLGYAYVKRPFIHKYMTLLEAGGNLHPLAHELCHLIIHTPDNPLRTYIIDYDPNYLNKTELFQNLYFQKIPRLDEELDWGQP